MSNPDPQNETQSTSDRAMADGGGAAGGPSAHRAPPQPAGSHQNPAFQAAAGAALAAVVGWLLWRFKLRRRPPTPSERVVDATQKLGSASVELGGRALGKLGDVAEPVAGAAVATGQKVGATLSEVPEVVAGAASERAQSVAKWWSKWMRRLTVVVFGGTGYVLGAAAGRERYDQIAGAARSVAGRPEVQQAKDKVRQKVQQQGGSETSGVGSAAP